MPAVAGSTGMGREPLHPRDAAWGALLTLGTPPTWSPSPSTSKAAVTAARAGKTRAGGVREQDVRPQGRKQRGQRAVTDLDGVMACMKHSCVVTLSRRAKLLIKTPGDVP